jgi:methionyl aminopeptidase
VAVGLISEDARKLMIATRDALYAGIAQAIPGNTLGDIGAAISKTARTAGFFVVEGLGGHGIGKRLHEDPFVANTGIKGHGHVLRQGMTLALEPMLAIGTSQIKQLGDDSFVTGDNSLSAHFEHTIIVTDAEPVIATKI